MRVVMLGKGGSGKSSLAGLLCGGLAARGDDVVAVDADTVPGLAPVLGLEPTDAWFLAHQAVRKNSGWQLQANLTEVVERCAQLGPGGIRFLQLGNADSATREFEAWREQFPERLSATMAFNTVARSYDRPGGWVVVDLQGGTVNVAGGLVGRVGVALVVVEPFAKSVLTARRFVRMGAWPAGVRLGAVANKVTGSDDADYLAKQLARINLPLWATIPADPTLSDVERSGRPLLEVPADAPARRAMDGLIERLVAEEATATQVASGSAASAGPVRD